MILVAFNSYLERTYKSIPLAINCFRNDSHHMEDVMRPILDIWLCLLFATPAMAKEPELSKLVKASLVFCEDPQASRQGRYPHVLQVFVRIENTSDSVLQWVFVPGDAETELLDSAGKRAWQGRGTGCFLGNHKAYSLSPGSYVDCLISQGGAHWSMEGGGSTGDYALIVGRQGGLIPIKSAESYSLRVRLRGIAGVKSVREIEGKSVETLLEIPPTKLKITR